jgi:peptide/nickel transport system substrate-binding protein
MMNSIAKYRASLMSGAISRREFMVQAIAAGLTVAAAGSLADTVLAATPKSGGRMRLGVGHGSTTDSLDPATYNDTYMQVVGFGLRNCLTEIDGEDKLVPELAESWEASSDATQWTFRLAKDVEFHNGKTMDADDVIASIRHHMGEESQSPAKGIMQTISEMRKDGSDTVVFVLQEGNADFPFLVSDYHLNILPVVDGVVDWRSGIGTGGYSLVEFEPGVRTTLKRNPNYFKQGRAHFDEADVLSIVDVTARTNAMTSGEVDAIDRVDLKTAHLFAERPGITLNETSGTLHYSYSMRCDTAPFDDPNVRLALKYAIDREAMLHTLLRGHGYVGNDHPIGKSNRYFAAELEQRPYDPDKARYHLKQAGMETLAVSLHVAETAFTGAVDGATIYREHAAAAGIDLTVVREPDDGFWSNVWGVEPWVSSYWGGRVTEDWMFSQVYAQGVPWNETKWANERFNTLLRQARSELDEAKRREMYVEMQRLCSDDGGALIPIFSNYVFATTDAIGHDEAMSAVWDLDGVKCLERWWHT